MTATATPTASPASDTSPPVLTRELLTLAAVVVLGAIMTILDATTSALNVIQRIAGSLGTALLAVALQRAIDANVADFHGGIGEASALVRVDPVHAGPAIAQAFGTTFWVAFGLTAAALIPALLLPPKRSQSR